MTPCVQVGDLLCGCNGQRLSRVKCQVFDRRMSQHDDKKW